MIETIPGPMPADLRALLTAGPWETRRTADRATGHYLTTAHECRTSGRPATADMLDRAYFAELDDPEPPDEWWHA
jgi:hypothetical protein